MPKYINNPELIGKRIEEVAPLIQSIVDLSPDNKSEIVSYIRSRLKECIIQDDVITALAIIDYTTHHTLVSGEDLALIKNTNTLPSISDIAYDNNKDDFALNLTGLCKALHYVDD